MLMLMLMDVKVDENQERKGYVRTWVGSCGHLHVPRYLSSRFL